MLALTRKPGEAILVGDDPKSIAPLFEIFTKGIEKIAEYSNDKK